MPNPDEYALEVAKAAAEAAGKESVNKLSIGIGGLFPFWGLKKKAVDAYINEITTSTLSPEAKMMAIANARKTYKDLYEKYRAEIQPQHDEVVALGGLYIIGTERHESRRIDNQLRGRAGRQGDVGTSRFFIAMEDDIMRLFGSERYMGFAERMGLPEDQPLETKMLSGAIENAQKKIEDRNFTSRKNVLQYDDVMNKQRELIYEQRRQVIDGMDIQKNITSMIEAMVLDLVTQYTASGEYPDDWNLKGLIEECEKIFLKEGEVVYTREDLEDLEKIDVIETLTEKALDCYKAREEEIGADNMRELERVIMLRVVDTLWMDHIDEMDQLKHSIWLRSYAQHDPVIEYKNVGSDMFDAMISSIKSQVGRYVLTARIANAERKEVFKPTDAKLDSAPGEETAKKVVKQAVSNKVGRNDPCPCGSGLKYKKCCGK